MQGAPPPGGKDAVWDTRARRYRGAKGRWVGSSVGDETITSVSLASSLAGEGESWQDLGEAAGEPPQMRWLGEERDGKGEGGDGQPPPDQRPDDQNAEDNLPHHAIMPGTDPPLDQDAEDDPLHPSEAAKRTDPPLDQNAEDDPLHPSEAAKRTDPPPDQNAEDDPLHQGRGYRGPHPPEAARPDALAQFFESLPSRAKTEERREPQPQQQMQPQQPQQLQQPQQQIQARDEEPSARMPKPAKARQAFTNAKHAQPAAKAGGATRLDKDYRQTGPAAALAEAKAAQATLDDTGKATAEYYAAARLEAERLRNRAAVADTTAMLREVEIEEQHALLDDAMTRLAEARRFQSQPEYETDEFFQEDAMSRLADDEQAQAALDLWAETQAAIDFRDARAAMLQEADQIMQERDKVPEGLTTPRREPDPGSPTEYFSPSEYAQAKTPEPKPIDSRSHFGLNTHTPTFGTATPEFTAHNPKSIAGQGPPPKAKSFPPMYAPYHDASHQQYQNHVPLPVPTPVQHMRVLYFVDSM